MLSAGLGVAYLPTFIVAPALAEGRLLPLLEDWCPAETGIYALYPPTRFVSRRVRDFIDFLGERFQGTPYWQRFRENT